MDMILMSAYEAATRLAERNTPLKSHTNLEVRTWKRMCIIRRYIYERNRRNRSK